MQEIRTIELVKRYKNLTAVDKLNLEIQQGELFSLLGVNGAGKTTAIKMLRDLEDILPSYFIRINKSTLANEHCIARFDAVFSGGVDAVFRCGYREYVSRRCFAEIKRRYEEV